MSTFTIAPGVAVERQKLMETRALVQANSGGGKSWVLRRLLEQTHGHIQQIVLDVEDEFYTLREQYDYVLVRRDDGDCVPEVRSAPLLARRLLELGVSAIISIYEMKHHERTAFVKAFLDAMVNAPKSLWHPVYVVVDEAHVFCPEKGKAESAGSVIDLMTRGRKRGFCGILATQRLAKLNKDAAAEANNKLIGRCAIDVDMHRAAEELGFRSKDDMLTLRTLEPGEFYAFGPAISNEVRKVQIGPVKTTHPKAGAAPVPIAPPKTKVVAVLSKLGDLPKEAQEELVTLDQLRREVTRLRGELTRAQHAQPKAPEPVVERVEVPVLDAAVAEQLSNFIRDGRILAEKITETTYEVSRAVDKAHHLCKDGQRSAANRLPRNSNTNGHERAASVAQRASTPAAGRLAPTGGESGGDGSVSGVMQRVLNALAELEQLGAAKPERELVAFMAGYTNLNSKGFTNAIGSLRTSGMIDYPDRGTIALTETGRQSAQYGTAPRNAEDVQQRICALLGGASSRILEPLIEVYPSALAREDVAARAGYGNLNSKGFTNAIGRLRSLGFIDYPERGTIKAQPVLFLEGGR